MSLLKLFAILVSSESFPLCDFSMTIDQCTHSFDELSRDVLPNYLARLRAKFVNPIPMSIFAQPGKGVRSSCRVLGLTGDFSGCYVLLENGKPFYVGISRTVLKRLQQHTKGKTHFDASLAYKVASADWVSCDQRKMTRTKRMEETCFSPVFRGAQESIRCQTVSFVEIPNPLELYLFEPYCAMELDTCPWNSFRTH